MPIAKHPISALTEADLQALVTGGVREDRTLEFKQDTYGASDDARVEFLADISAFANTLGGDLVLGVEEAQGVASASVGMATVTDIDQEILRLTQIARSGLQPRLPVLELHPVPLTGGRHALVIRVGRSYQAPHRVIFKGRNRFWARSSVSRYEPDVDELRALFSVAPQVATRVREMRSDRVVRILAGETPIPLKDDPGISILHLIPLASADPMPRQVDLDRLRSAGAWFPWGATGYNERKNFDGFLTYSSAEGEKTRAYIQVFRSGVVEVAATGTVLVHNMTRTVWVKQLARDFVQQVHKLVPVLLSAEVDPPYSVQLTISGVRGTTFRVENTNPAFLLHHASLAVERDTLFFMDALLAEGDSTFGQIATALKPTLDQLFQTAAYRACPWFNADGSVRLT